MARLVLISALLAIFLWTADSHTAEGNDLGPKSLAGVESKFVEPEPEPAGGRDAAANYFADLVGLDEAVIEEEIPAEDSDEDQSYDGLSNYLTDGMMGGSDVDEEFESGPRPVKGLALTPANLDHGETVEKIHSSKGDDLVDLFGQGLSTSSLTTGAEVNLLLDDLSSNSEGTVRMFKRGRNSTRTCSSSDPTKVMTAQCGNHYLYPGETMRLKSTSNACSWNFRHSSPEIVVSLKGSQLEKDLSFEIKERIVTTSLKEIPDESERNLKATKKVFKDLVVTTPAIISPVPGEIDAEVCVPSTADNPLAEYENFEPKCCTGSRTCGVAPIGKFVGMNLTMHALPWEAVLTVKGNRHSDTEEAYCSGSLISREWMLTTASCFIRHGVIDSEDMDFVPEVEVSFGLEADPFPVETHSLLEIHVFPTSTESHDIALVRLKERSSRMPVCLPGFKKPNPVLNLVNRNAYVFGWVLETKPVYMSGLRQKVLDSKTCSSRMGKKLPPHMICSDDVPGNRPCLPDGDLLLDNRNRYFLVGLSNPRLECVHDLRPHTSVSYFMPWISSVTGIPIPDNLPF